MVHRPFRRRRLVRCGSLSRDAVGRARGKPGRSWAVSGRGEYRLVLLATCMTRGAEYPTAVIPARVVVQRCPDPVGRVVVLPFRAVNHGSGQVDACVAWQLLSVAGERHCCTRPVLVGRGWVCVATGE